MTPASTMPYASSDWQQLLDLPIHGENKNVICCMSPQAEVNQVKNTPRCGHIAGEHPVPRLPVCCLGSGW